MFERNFGIIDQKAKFKTAAPAYVTSPTIARAFVSSRYLFCLDYLLLCLFLRFFVFRSIPNTQRLRLIRCFPRLRYTFQVRKNVLRDIFRTYFLFLFTIIMFSFYRQQPLIYFICCGKLKKAQSSRLGTRERNATTFFNCLQNSKRRSKIHFLT